MLCQQALLNGMSVTPLDIARHKLERKAISAAQRKRHGEVCLFLIDTMIQLQVPTSETLQKVREKCERLMNSSEV
jgi:hypothetical protein